LLKFGNPVFLHNLAFDQLPFGEDVLAMFVVGGFDIGGIGGHHPYSVAFLVPCNP
jgi:hypothetical protein